jgi:SAM-dependent methyltransferase
MTSSIVVVRHIKSTGSRKINMLNDDDLMALYATKVRRPESYFHKYRRMPECPIDVWGRDWTNKDFPRCIAVLDFQAWVATHNIQVNALAYTYEGDPELQFLAPKSKVFLPYPENDLHTVSNRYTEQFDFFMFNQTLEHLHSPHVAVKSIYETLVPGGYVFTSVPTLNIPHSTPYHYGGMTPMGLAVLFKNAGFEIVDMGQWGNLRYLHALFSEHEWPDIRKVQEGDGSISNEDRNVCQCWILAQKPAK